MPQYVAIINENDNPYLSVYPWDTQTGFGVRSSVDIGFRPPTDVKISPDAAVVGIAHRNSPWISVYPIGPSGIGTKYADPAQLANGATRATGIDFNSDGSVVAISFDEASPYVIAYPWDNSSGFGAKYANPSSLAGYLFSTVRELKFSPDDSAIAFNTDVSPITHVYAWSNQSGFGTKYAGPSSAISGAGLCIDFSPDGQAIAIGTNQDLFVYSWSSQSGFGAKYTNPASLLSDQGVFGVKFGRDGQSITVATAYGVFSYEWSSATGFGTKYADPINLTSGTAYGIDYSIDNDAIAIAHENLPLITVFPWSNASGFGTKYSNPSVLPNPFGAGLEVSFGSTPQISEFDVIGSFDSVLGNIQSFLYLGINLEVRAQIDGPLSTQIESLANSEPSINFAANSVLGDINSIISADPSIILELPSLLPTIQSVAFHDFTGQLGDATTYYVMDLIGPGGTTRVPISSWQATLQTGQSNYVQCVVPAAQAYASAIAAADEFVISRLVSAPGVGDLAYEMATAPVQTATFDQGPSRYTCTLSGYSPGFAVEEDPSPAYHRTLQDIRSISVSTVGEISGGVRVRCSIDWLLRPGMLAILGNRTFIVAYINYYVGNNDAYMDVGERA